MIHEIAPHDYHVEYGKKRPARPDDYVIIIDGREVWLLADGEKAAVPTVEQYLKAYPDAAEKLAYLFMVDETACFTQMDASVAEADGFTKASWWMPGECGPDWMHFAITIAGSITRWMDSHRFCGHCGAPMEPSDRERAFVCPSCGRVEYPKICPVIMVGITDGNRLLTISSPYNHGVRYAMIAGFVEVGETLEDAVHREAMEEVGLKVKNLRYFKSQPWALTDVLLSGFYVDVDGDPTVHPDGDEVSSAVWFEREDIPLQQGPPSISLAYDMMWSFHEGKA